MEQNFTEQQGSAAGALSAEEERLPALRGAVIKGGKYYGKRSNRSLEGM